MGENNIWISFFILKQFKNFSIKYLSIKDEFSIEPQYAHHTKKHLDKSKKNTHILETDHPRTLKFEKFPFFLGFLIVELFS